MHSIDNGGTGEGKASPPPDDTIAAAVDRASRMLGVGATRFEVLTFLARSAQSVAGTGATVSILVLDEHGLLRNGASPDLPADYLAAIDRLKPDASVGTCAASAATGSIVVTPDFRADDKWAELRHLPLALGYSGAWSYPIKSADGQVLGTFGTYYRDSRTPTADERRAVARLAAMAAKVLAARGAPGAGAH
jgi:GAF domain-containing protein